MKRTLHLIAASLCCYPAFSQEPESAEKSTQFSIVSRFDANPSFATSSGGFSNFGFANSSIYSFLEGSIGEHFSYAVCNHWLSTDPKTLYENSLHSDENTWLDWANVTYSVGNWTFTAGKDVMAICGFEMDPYDVDSHLELNSIFWNSVPVYQWGGKATYTLPSENTTLAVQMTSSPYGVHPFDSGLYAYALQWKGEYGAYSGIASINTIEAYNNEYTTSFSMGHKVCVGDFEIGIDWLQRLDGESYINQNTMLLGTLQYNRSEKMEFLLKGGYESVQNKVDDDYEIEDLVPLELWHKDYVFGGIAAHYYPLRNTKSLRLHAIVATNNYTDAVSLNVGATYNFSVK